MTRSPVAVLALACLAASTPLQAADPIRWRGDYNAARAEAAEKSVPLVVVVGSPACRHCREQDATTFLDTALAEYLNANAVVVKVNGVEQRGFVEAMQIKLYPTTLIASPDGTVAAFLQGYITADKLRDHVKAAAAGVAVPEWAARDYARGEKLLGLGDATRALTLWRAVAAALTDSPARTKAVAGIAGIEAAAAARLARGRELEAQPEAAAAAGVYAELIRSHGGTAAAGEATARLTALAARGKGVDRVRVQLARELLDLAREDLRRERVADGLERCGRVGRDFPDLAEGKAAADLRAAVEADPVKLAVASEQLQLRAADLQLTLAEGWLRRGEVARAAACLERVPALAPNSRPAEVAAARLAKLAKPGVPATTAAYRKAP